MESSTEINYNESIDPSLFETQKDLEHFTCTLCTLIPNPSVAIEESECGHIFCPDCLDKWKSKHSNCPFCRHENVDSSLREVKTKNKFLFRHLQELTIKCPYKCSWSGSWDSLTKHLLSCVNFETPCKYVHVGCNYKGKGQEKFDHEKNEDKKHLELAMKFIEDNHIKKKDAKENYELNKQYKASTHPHPLIYRGTGPFGLDWSCDGRKFPGGCFSGITGFGQTKDVKRFRCKGCDFDLCINCMNHYII